MKKLLSLTFVALALGVICSQRSEAANPTRSPKEIKTLGFSNVISSVTTISVAQSTAGVTVPGAIYALYLSTGASGDYVVLLDTSSTLGYGIGTVGANGAGSLTNQIGPRYFFGSTSAGTVITFDPPVLFFNGLMIIQSSSTNVIGVEYETGRGISGQ